MHYLSFLCGAAMAAFSCFMAYNEKPNWGWVLIASLIVMGAAFPKGKEDE